MDGTQRRRSPGGVPLPPRTLARRFHFLDERISLAEETFSAFRKAGLVRAYDPIEALIGLKGALGQKANENRRIEALVWAFQVWRSAGLRVEEGRLKCWACMCRHIPDGYLLRAQFIPASWPGLGSTLENYLVEAADFLRIASRSARLPPNLVRPLAEALQDGKDQWGRSLRSSAL